MQQAVLLETAVMRMRMAGVRPEHLDFYKDDGTGTTFPNANCTQDSCRVYAPGGGNASPIMTPTAAMASGVTDNVLSNGKASSTAILVSVSGLGTDEADVGIVIRGLSKRVCDEINIKSGVYEAGDSELSENLETLNTDYYIMNGDRDPFPTVTVNHLGDDDPRVSGHNVFCFNRSGTAGYYAFYALSVQ